MEKITFTNNTGEPISADNLNKIQSNVEKEISSLNKKDTEMATDIENLKSFVLYENPSGTRDNITLSDDVKNYKYLEFIGYGSVFNQMAYVKYDVTSGKDIPLYCISTNGEQIRFNVITYKVSANTLTKDKDISFLFISTSNASTSHQNDLRITKVLGYK